MNLSLLSFLFQWFTLNDIKHGRVHLVLEWLPTSTQRDRLDQVSFSRKHTESVGCDIYIYNWLNTNNGLFLLGNADANLSDLPEQVCAVSSVVVYLLRKSSWSACESMYFYTLSFIEITLKKQNMYEFISRMFKYFKLFKNMYVYNIIYIIKYVYICIII